MATKKTKKPTDVGLLHPNRTGIQASPVDAAAQKEAVDKYPPSTDAIASPLEIHELCIEYEKEASPIGTMPPPGTMKGLGKTMLTALKGGKATVLLDKLGERLAFERTGTRLYEGLLVKVDALGSFEGGPTREEIAHFLDEELAHFHLLKEAIEQMGADPTAMTPFANASAVASDGIPKVILDPRMNLAQALHGIHIAELADNDGWQMLIALSEEMGQTDIATRFRQALEEEDKHLEAVRRWLTSYTSLAAKREVPEAGGEEAAIP